jgi:hypothetical protein
MACQKVAAGGVKPWGLGGAGLSSAEIWYNAHHFGKNNHSCVPRLSRDEFR